MRLIWTPVVAGLVILVGPAAQAQPPEKPVEPERTTDEVQNGKIAMEIDIPISQIVNVPFENDIENGGGPMDNGSRYSLIAQPVVPITITRTGWKLITRAVIPFVSQNHLFGNSSQTGLADSTLGVYVSKPFGPWRWGVGPILGVPTATEDSLGTGQWSLGPTGVFAYQRMPWTGGVLASQLWSFAGDSMRPDVNATLMQPFFAYTLPAGTSFRVVSETRYDWEAKQWTVPVAGLIAQVIRIDGVPVEIATGPIYTFESPNIAPGGFGWRVNVTAAQQ